MMMMVMLVLALLLGGVSFGMMLLLLVFLRLGLLLGDDILGGMSVPFVVMHFGCFLLGHFVVLGSGGSSDLRISDRFQAGFNDLIWRYGRSSTFMKSAIISSAALLIDRLLYEDDD